MVATLSIEPLFSDEVRLDPYPYYAKLHEHGPVCRLESEGRQYQFLITGYDAYKDSAPGAAGRRRQASS